MSTENIKLRTNPNKKRKLTVKVSKTGADLLKTGKMPLVGLIGLLGGIGGAKGYDYANDKFAERDNSTDAAEDADVEDDSNELYDYEMPTSVEFADTVTDDMSYGEAFGAAREELGQGGFFTWKGQHYNTYTKEEWDSFSDEDKKEFFKLFKENTDFEDGEAHKNDTDNFTPDKSENEEEKDNTQDEEKESNNDDEENEIEEVELEEIGTDEEIIDGLNDGEAYTEEDNFGEDIT